MRALSIGRSDRGLQPVGSDPESVTSRCSAASSSSSLSVHNSNVVSHPFWITANYYLVTLERSLQAVCPSDCELQTRERFEGWPAWVSCPSFKFFVISSPPPIPHSRTPPTHTPIPVITAIPPPPPHHRIDIRIRASRRTPHPHARPAAYSYLAAAPHIGARTRTPPHASLVTTCTHPTTPPLLNRTTHDTHTRVSTARHLWRVAAITPLAPRHRSAAVPYPLFHPHRAASPLYRSPQPHLRTAPPPAEDPSTHPYPPPSRRISHQLPYPFATCTPAHPHSPAAQPSSAPIPRPRTPISAAAEPSRHTYPAEAPIPLDPYSPP
ncbi:hypothetical protein R3P38DRAFT_3224862 [Favolaschia claudopus]|uniref:Uncharacterized protein n=1 Tax=Favolaschia claudopus TaxID=2862362 RepID=A0AAV9ZWW4_9AGAR